jgi:hypothetical protein
VQEGSKTETIAEKERRVKEDLLKQVEGIAGIFNQSIMKIF